jgi:hypothetical protein
MSGIVGLPVFRDPLMTDRAEVGELISPLPHRHDGDEGYGDTDSHDDPHSGHECVLLG